MTQHLSLARTLRAEGRAMLRTRPDEARALIIHANQLEGRQTRGRPWHNGG